MYNIKRFIKHLLFNKMLLLFIILLFFIFTTLISVDKVYATEANHKEIILTYKSVRVVQGDTLWSICNNYFNPSMNISLTDYIKSVKKINNISNSKICAGCYIIIPQILH